MAAAVHADFQESFESLGPITDSAEFTGFADSGKKREKRSTRFSIEGAPADDGVPEAPRSSLPVHPSGIWSKSGTDGLMEILSAQHSEVLTRLTAQDEILRRLVPNLGLSVEASLIPDDGIVAASSMLPHPATAKLSSRNTTRSVRSTTRSTRNQNPEAKDSEVKPQASTSLRPGFFRTFTQVDSSLRYAASAIAASRARHRFASIHLRSTSSEDGNAGCIVRTVEGICFDFFFAVMVLVNCVFIGIEVQHSIAYPDSKAISLIVLQYILALLFAIELAMRLCAYGCREFFCGEDWLWSLLDAFIVLSSIWDIVLDVLFLWDASDNPVSTLRAIRILRLARIVKAVRLMRVFRFVRALRTLISSIFHTLKSLFWALVLMVLILYVFGVLFFQAVNSYLLDPDNPPLPDSAFEAASKHYYSLAGTMMSLFMCISGGTNWENVLAPLISISEFWILLFLFYVAFTYLAVLNVLTAVFCQSAIESAQSDQASLVQHILEEKEAHRDKLLDLFEQVGEEDGTITFEVFQEKINEPAVREYFTSIGLDVWDAWSFFKLLDLDEGGSVEVDEFLMGCLRLRGQARAVDVGKIIYDQTWMIRNQSYFQSYVEVQLKQVKDLLSRLTGVRLQSVHVLGTSHP